MRNQMQNIEIKTPIDSIEAIEILLLEIGVEKIWTRKQCDTFFEVARGWLKLREADDCQPELISYVRSINDSGPRPSTYDLAPLDDAEQWKRLLGRVLDSECVVRKTRTLWIWKHTRIHVDVVESLGQFLELETVIKDITTEEAEREAAQMIAHLQLDPERFISIPYREMLRTEFRTPHSAFRIGFTRSTQ